MKKIELELENVNIQKNVKIVQEDVTKQPQKMPNWNASGLDGIHGLLVQEVY